MSYLTCKIIKQKHIMVKGVRRKREGETKAVSFTGIVFPLSKY
jgi:hypothetical protein